MKKAKDLRNFKVQMRSHKTRHEKIFYDYYRQLYTKEDFKNQIIIGFYIVDFIILPQLLIVEIDGSSHETRKYYDTLRDKFLKECGFNILRIKNEEIENHFEQVFIKINSYSFIPDYLRKFRHGLSHANILKGKAIKRQKEQVKNQLRLI